MILITLGISFINIYGVGVQGGCAHAFWCPWRSEEGVGSLALGLQVAVNCLAMVLEAELQLLEEQLVLAAVEPALQPLTRFEN